MRACEELAEFICSGKYQEKMLIGEMTSKTTCKIGDDEYLQDDFYVSEHLKYPLCIRTRWSSEGDQSKYLQPLAENDLVLVYQISEDKFVILERLVGL